MELKISQKVFLAVLILGHDGTVSQSEITTHHVLKLASSNVGEPKYVYLSKTGGAMTRIERICVTHAEALERMKLKINFRIARLNEALNKIREQ